MMVFYYDRLCLLNLKTETGFIGRVVQDVITAPTRKWARAQGETGFIEWHCGNKKDIDTVLFSNNLSKTKTMEYKKTRPEDFIEEVKHIQDVIEGKIENTPISLEYGLDTMMVIVICLKNIRNQWKLIIAKVIE